MPCYFADSALLALDRPTAFKGYRAWPIYGDSCSHVLPRVGTTRKPFFQMWFMSCVELLGHGRPHLLSQKLAGAFLFSPWTNLMCNTPEYYTNAFSRIQGQGKFKARLRVQVSHDSHVFEQILETTHPAVARDTLQSCITRCFHHVLELGL